MQPVVFASNERRKPLPREISTRFRFFNIICGRKRGTASEGVQSMSATTAPSQPDPAENPDAQLAALGLTLDEVAKARGMAQVDVDQCTDLDPLGFRGTMRTGRTMRYLREALVVRRWRPDNSGNQPSVVSPDGRIAIVCASGDPATGLLGCTPKSKYPKGEVTQRRVRKNVQLSFFEPIEDDAPVAHDDERTTWVMLQHPAGEAVRAEISCPSGFDDSGRIDEWSHRIVLPELPVDTYENWVTDSDDDDGNEALDVPVTPR
jgi:hypothetical protein